MRKCSKPICDDRNQGYTLIELLVVIAIIAILIGLLLAAVQQVRAAASQKQCANQLRQLTLASIHYEGVHRFFPVGISVQNGKSSQLYLGWLARILPYLEQEELWRQTEQAFRQEPRFFINPPHIGLATVVRLFLCPYDDRIQEAQISQGVLVAFTSYVGNAGTDYLSNNGVLYTDSRVSMSAITDGTSQTLLIGERPPSADLGYGWWYAGLGQGKSGSAEMILGVRERNHPKEGVLRCPPGPYQFQNGSIHDVCDLFHFWSLHSGGAHFAFCDGSIHFLRYSSDSILPALGTRSGQEVFEMP